jgi:4-amino-4-deoxy-L-arabinose transferase-like glycosyltransferase
MTHTEVTTPRKEPHATRPTHQSGVQPVWPARSRFALPAIVLGLFVLALLPCALALGDFVTIDEASKWFARSERFQQALLAGDYADTNQTGHPGVTTMWLGTAGLRLHGWLAEAGWIAPDDLAAYRTLLRLPVAFVTALSVALGYLLLRQVLDQRVALLGALFWATEPFLVAHGQVLHLDGLLTAFMTLALLAALVAFAESGDRGQGTGDRGQRKNVYLVASAVAGGLAFLTKAPAVLLLPMMGLIMLVGVVRAADREPRTGKHKGSNHLPVGLRVLATWCLFFSAWCLIALLVWLALWPATWVDPIGAVMSVVNEVIANGGAPHNTGNFFFGQTVDDPGPLFYPVVIALRLTPWTLVGLLLTIVLALLPGRHADAPQPSAAGKSHSWRALFRRGGRSSATLGLLLVFVLLFTLFMTIPPKKFDRYLLPIFPALAILAAAGWVWFITLTLPRLKRYNVSTVQRLLWPVIMLLLAANLAWYHPYSFAYYNPLLGGGPVAARTIPVGWGEGYEQAGAFIVAQFNGCERPVASWFGPVLHHFVCTEVVPLSELRDAGYAVLYIDQLQRNNEPEAIKQLYGKVPPLHTVQIHGIEYAYVYQIAPPVAHPLAADFGPAIHLRGYDLNVGHVQDSSTLTLTLEWETQAPLEQDYMLFVHLLDSDGNRVAQVDVPPGGQHLPTSIWQPDRYLSLEQPLPLPANLAAGSYWISLGIYDPQTFARLPLQGPTPPDAPSNGPDALLIGPVNLPADAERN